MSAVLVIQARESKTIACQGIEQTFNNTTSTVVQKQQYAECVQLLHPASATGTELLLAKLAVLTLFAGAILGGWLSWRSDFPIGNKLIDVPIGMFFGTVFSGLFVMAVVAVCQGIALLLQ